MDGRGGKEGSWREGELEGRGGEGRGGEVREGERKAMGAGRERSWTSRQMEWNGGDLSKSCRGWGWFLQGSKGELEGRGAECEAMGAEREERGGEFWRIRLLEGKRSWKGAGGEGLIELKGRGAEREGAGVKGRVAELKKRGGDERTGRGELEGRDWSWRRRGRELEDKRRGAGREWRGAG